MHKTIERIEGLNSPNCNAHATKSVATCVSQNNSAHWCQIGITQIFPHCNIGWFSHFIPNCFSVDGSPDVRRNRSGICWQNQPGADSVCLLLRGRIRKWGIMMLSCLFWALLFILYISSWSTWASDVIRNYPNSICGENLFMVNALCTCRRKGEHLDLYFRSLLCVSFPGSLTGMADQGANHVSVYGPDGSAVSITSSINYV